MKPNQVILLGYDRLHFMTTDNGVTWKNITVPFQPQIPIFNFHPDDSNYLIFHGQNCNLDSCPTSV